MNKFFGVVVVAAVAVGAYFFMDSDQTQGLSQGESAESDDGLVRVYKWQDAQGYWQVTDQPPAQGIAYELKEYVPDVIPLPLPPGPAQ